MAPEDPVTGGLGRNPRRVVDGTGIMVFWFVSRDLSMVDSGEGVYRYYGGHFEGVG